MIINVHLKKADPEEYLHGDQAQHKTSAAINNALE